jgi:hypothetical protein
MRSPRLAADTTQLQIGSVGYTNPGALIFKGPIAARLHATICGECGYTELIAEIPAALYEAFMKSMSSKKA